MKVNWNLVVDVVVALVGVYVLMNGIWMKSTGKTSSLLATPEELKKCKHPEKRRSNTENASLRSTGISIWHCDGIG